MCLSRSLSSAPLVVQGSKKQRTPPTSRLELLESGNGIRTEGQEKRSKWSRKVNNESLGYPVRQVRTERPPSLEIEGMEDPLDGNPNYRLIHALNPGSSGSVYRCTDLRSNVRAHCSKCS